MDLKKIYECRFQEIDQERRFAVWQHIANWVMKQLGNPQKILEVGAGRCEFINQCGAKEKWAVDFDPGTREYANDDVKVITGKLSSLCHLPFRKFS